MPRKGLLAILALLFITPALAQVIQVQKLERPVVINPIPTPEQLTADPNSDIAEKVMTIEEAKAQIAKLRQERRELNAKLAEAVATIEQMTKPGGSLVRAYCESPEVSRNTAGATENCGRYQCGQVDGLCKKSCSGASAGECASGYSCNNGRCMTLTEVHAETGAE